MMKKVYICAPLGGDVEGNIKRVKRYTGYALKCGVAPVVPYFYSLCLDDNVPAERELGMAAGLSLSWFCAIFWGDWGTGREKYKKLQQAEMNRMKAKDIN